MGLDCPSPETLLAWNLGAHDGESAARVRAHLEGCGPCRLRVEVLLSQTQKPASVPTSEPPADAVLAGRYRLGAPLGAGAMGRVFRAFDLELERDVALKFVDAPPDGAARRLGLDEARALARVNHPNVVSVYGAFADGPWDIIAMEFVDGEDLRDWLRSPRPRAEIDRVLRQAATGLEAVHRAGLLHRDFKPANVMVGRDGRVRVSDFGLSRRAPSPHAGATLATGLAGTPAYMAPELAAGAQPTRAVDQFALGLTALEALTGTRAPSKGPGLSPWNRCVQADPDQRWPDLADLLAALEARPRRARWLRNSGLVLLATAVTAVAVGVGRPAPRPLACAQLATRLEALEHSRRPAFSRALALLPPAVAQSDARLFGTQRDTVGRLLTSTCVAEHDAERQHLQLARLDCLERVTSNLELVVHSATEVPDRDWLARVGHDLVLFAPAQRCGDDANVGRLGASPGNPTALDDDVERLVADLDTHPTTVLERLPALLTLAHERHQRWAEATLLAVRAEFESSGQRPDEARRDIEAALALADAEGFDGQWLELVQKRLALARSPDDALTWLDLAHTRARRLGILELAEPDLDEATGRALERTGDLDGASARFRSALERWRALLQADDATVVREQVLLGHTLVELGEFAGAQAVLEQAAHTAAALMGPDSANEVDALEEQTRLALLRKDVDRARQLVTLTADMRARRELEPETMLPFWLATVEGHAAARPTPRGEGDDELLAIIEAEAALAHHERLAAPPPGVGPRHWLRVALTAHANGDRALAQQVVETPPKVTGALARAHALVTLGRFDEADALLPPRSGLVLH